jgi:hypothetical protein
MLVYRVLYQSDPPTRCSLDLRVLSLAAAHALFREPQASRRVEKTPPKAGMLFRVSEIRPCGEPWLSGPK